MMTGTHAYRGYLVTLTIAAGYAISKNKFHIAYARDVQHAHEIIDMLLGD